MKSIGRWVKIRDKESKLRLFDICHIFSSIEGQVMSVV